MRRSWIAAGAIALTSLAAAGTADAQFWLSDRGLTEGRGFRAGSFEFHPGAAAEVGYDSNVFGSPPGGGILPVEPALHLRGTASLSLSTLGSQRLNPATGGAVAGAPLPTANFRANVAVIGHLFVPVTSGSNVLSQSNVGANAGFRLELFPGRTWQFNLYDDFSRVVQGGPDFGVAIAFYNGIRNNAGFDLVYAPGGGIIDLRLSYVNYLTIYEQSGAQLFNNMINTIAVRNRWRFLPKTSLLWEGIISPSVYLSPGPTPPIGLNTSYPITTRFGLNGLLTDRIGVLVMVGYTGTYFVHGDNADTFVGQGEFKYILGPASAFQLGIQRDVQPSYIGNYYIRNRLYLQYSQSFGGRFWISAEGSAGIYQYGYASLPNSDVVDPTRFIGTDPDGHFNTWRLQGILFGEYRFNDWFGLNATVNVNANISDVRLVTNIPTVPNVSVAWTIFQAFIGARVMF